MVFSNSGINYITIGTDDYYTLASGNTIKITSQETNEEKEIIASGYTNDRYTEWEFTLVENYDDEVLSAQTMYLRRGFYDIKIYNSTSVIYENVLFVNINIPTINTIDDDDIIYTIND